MPSINLGRVGVVSQGDWSAGSYKKLDVVRYSGAAYIANKATSETPGIAAVDWDLMVQDGAGGDVTTSGTQTLTNKTIEAGVFTNGYTEEVYAPAAGSAFTVSLADGSIQAFTTNANTTITLPTVVAGKSFQLQIAFGGAHTLAFAGATLKWTATPTFSGASGKTDIVNFTANAAGTAWMGSVFGLGYTT